MSAKKAVTSGQHQVDADLHKGAMESQAPQQQGNNSLRGQLGHRTEDDLIKSSDSDFPEPGGNPEHSGEADENNAKKSPEGVTQDQDSGQRQKRNQGDRREDPLAS